MSAPRSRGEAASLPWQRWLHGALVLAAVAAHLVRSSLQQDFSAFFMAGRALTTGRNPYLNDAVDLWDGVALFHHSRFLYAPLFAFCMRAFAALPYFAAKAVFTALSLACWVAVLRGLCGLLALRPTGQRWAVALGVCFPPVWLTLERGQTDLIALAALIHAWTHRQRSWRAGAFVALAMFIKPLLLPAWLALLVGRQTRTALVALGFLFGALLLGVLAGGAPLTWNYLTEVVPRVAHLGEGGGAADLLTDDQLSLRDGRVDGEERVLVDGRAYAPEPVAILRSANLSRLLAPHRPSVLGLLAPPLLFLAWLGYGFRPRCAGPWVWVACPLAVVVCSPTGWAMSLTWALPILLLGVAQLQDTTLAPQRSVQRLLVAGVLMSLLGPWLTGAWVLAGVLWVAAATAAISATSPTSATETEGPPS